MDPLTLLVLLLLAPVALMGLCGLSGQAIGRRHLRAIAAREVALRAIPADDLPEPPGGFGERAVMVSSAVVLGSDLLTIIGASLRSLTGGEVRRYGPLLQRARREAVLRLQEEARALGFDGVCNVRIEWVQLGSPMVAIHAYGTAYEAPPPADLSAGG